jgi:hypothetical protein
VDRTATSIHPRPTALRRLSTPALGIALGLALLAGVLTAPGWDRSAHAAGSAGWKNHCDWSHSAPDDPIVKPGEPGAAHLHDFFGNRSTDARSSYDSMVSASTACDMPADTGSYWVPALYKDGKKIDPRGFMLGDNISNTFYYRDSGTDLPEVPFPADLRMIAGNAHAKSEAGNAIYGEEIYWQCENGDTTHRRYPADCPTGIVVLKVHFPTCWDGSLTHQDDTASMRFKVKNSCPAGWKAVPELILRLEYPVGTDSSGIALPSGPVWTAHADFWNTWHQPTLAKLTRDCLGAGVDCGTDPDMGGDPVANTTPNAGSSSTGGSGGGSGSGSKGVRIAKVRYNSRGADDHSNRSLNREWFVVTNRGGRTRNLAGWRVRDKQGHVYRFSTLRLAPGDRVKVRTGRGSDGETQRFWGRKRYVWGNRADTATLLRRSGRVADRCSWSSKGRGYTAC